MCGAWLSCTCKGRMSFAGVLLRKKIFLCSYAGKHTEMTSRNINDAIELYDVCFCVITLHGLHSPKPVKYINAVVLKVL